MISAPLPPDEQERLQVLQDYHILDTLPEQAFDDITKLAAYICQAPMSLVTLVDGDRQWFKSRVGVDATETPRALSFCAHGILQQDVFVVQDALQDERFAGHPLVEGEFGIRFYAGAPLLAPTGHALGMVCVVDHHPRELSSEQLEALRCLSRQAVAQLELRKSARNLSARVDELANAQQRLAKAAAKLEHQALHDSLTGLPNRTLFFNRLRHLLSEGLREQNPQVAVLFIDLDHFKQVNDSLGHAAGDQLLGTVAQRLQTCLRPTDTVARLGGDEFAVLLPGMVDEATARTIAERMLQRVAEPVEIDGLMVTASASIGIKMIPSHHFANPEEVLRAADNAMYEAKESGRGCLGVAP